ncbi:hydroxyacyl-coenzyme A dehydrogenase, mitochondrial-like isoform X2 [Paramacrobiotus metropolitanus]|nr:hydroxyacyl-coenzyme A dehydrogenase, mitochondrial-like isoform X2 [Paramacrobiotus metropolitanus]
MNVTLVDHSDDILDRALEHIDKSYSKIVAKQYPHDKVKAKTLVEGTLSRIRTARDPCQPAGQADLIIEAVVENLELKKELFKRLDKTAANHTIFASNTSSLSITAMASVTERRDRFGGLHFFSPVPMMKLVEVVRLETTSDATFDSLMDFAKKIDKVPVACKDTPGFIVNRLLIPYSLEAVRMVERGDATAQDIDTAMKLGAGYKMGPLELMDFTGVDLANMIMDAWAKDHGHNPVFKTIPLITQMVKEGRLGRKSGKGFYDYTESSEKAAQEKQKIKAK